MPARARSVRVTTSRSAYDDGQAVTLSTAEIPTGADPDRPLTGKVAVVTGAARGIGAAIAKRLAMARKAVELGINVQITISPCLPYTNAHDFTQTLLDTGAQRFVVDTLKSGDGAHGGRSARSSYAKLAPDWENEEHASLLYEQLVSAGAHVGWSSEGFCGIPYRNEAAPEGTMRSSIRRKSRSGSRFNAATTSYRAKGGNISSWSRNAQNLPCASASA